MRGPQTAGAGRPPPCRCPVPASGPRQVSAGPGGGRRGPAGGGRGAPFWRKRRPTAEPQGSGAPPPAGWAGPPQRAADGEPGPPPACLPLALVSTN